MLTKLQQQNKTLSRLDGRISQVKNTPNILNDNLLNMRPSCSGLVLSPLIPKILNKPMIKRKILFDKADDFFSINTDEG